MQQSTTHKPKTAQSDKAQTATQRVTKTLPKKVMQSIENEIINGKYAIGDKIPPEPELVQHFQVSRNSVREAVQSLIQAGILEARQGSGTYVIAISRLEVEITKLCNQCEAEEINELRNILGKFIAKTASKRRNNTEAQNIEEKAIQLRNCAHNIIQANKMLPDNCKLTKNTENKNVNLQPTTTKSIKKETAKITAPHVAPDALPGKIQNGENPNALSPDISLLRALDHEYTVALSQGAHNNALASLFICLQKQYLTHKVKENKDTWLQNIKRYGQLADAISNKNTKAIKKLIDILYN